MEVLAAETEKDAAFVEEAIAAVKVEEVVEESRDAVAMLAMEAVTVAAEDEKIRVVKEFAVIKIKVNRKGRYIAGLLFMLHHTQAKI